MDDYTGKRLDGRYEIQEVMGVGGMAVVYKAYDNIDDRIVAVKILKDEFLANEEFRRRFKNESKAISLLSHPNIVKIYNVNYGDRL
ncbi:MAG: protein kinase, partial [Clostridia bacterium]|nr:protein kinase [Clostridia bacterium]